MMLEIQRGFESFLWFCKQCNIYFLIQIGRCVLFSFVALGIVLILRCSLLKEKIFLKGMLWSLFLLVPFVGKLELFYNDNLLCRPFLWWHDFCCEYPAIGYGYLFGMVISGVLIFRQHGKLYKQIERMEQRTIGGKKAYISEIPLQHNIQFEITANKLRQKIGSFYDKTKATEGVAEADKRYVGMSDWKTATDEIGTTLDNMKTLFDELLKTIKNSRDNDDASKYADSILKSINSGMAGVEEKKNTFRGTLDDAQNDKLKELWDLIEQKTGIYQDYNKKYSSDEEKYRSFLKESSQFSGIDSRIDELLKEITGA